MSKGKVELISEEEEGQTSSSSEGKKKKETGSSSGPSPTLPVSPVVGQSPTVTNVSSEEDDVQELPMVETVSPAEKSPGFFSKLKNFFWPAAARDNEPLLQMQSPENSEIEVEDRSPPTDFLTRVRNLFSRSPQVSLIELEVEDQPPSFLTRVKNLFLASPKDLKKEGDAASVVDLITGKKAGATTLSEDPVVPKTTTSFLSRIFSRFSPVATPPVTALPGVVPPKSPAVIPVSPPVVAKERPVRTFNQDLLSLPGSQFKAEIFADDKCALSASPKTLQNGDRQKTIAEIVYCGLNSGRFDTEVEFRGSKDSINNGLRAIFTFNPDYDGEIKIAGWTDAQVTTQITLIKNEVLGEKKAQFNTLKTEVLELYPAHIPPSEASPRHSP